MNIRRIFTGLYYPGSQERPLRSLSLSIVLVLSACGGDAQDDTDDPINSSSSSSSSSTTSSSSSSSSTSSSSGDPQSNIARGKALYESDLACATCHGFSGEGAENGTPIDKSMEAFGEDSTLVEFIDEFMPLGNEGRCTGSCAEDIAAYIESW